MDSLELQHIVNQFKSLKQTFRGIYSSNNLPIHVYQYPSAYICNTEPAGTRGSHWVAFWFQNTNECEFYDSFGKRPEDYSPNMRDFIDRNGYVCTYNNVQLQSKDATTCGFHVLFYLYFRRKGVPMITFVKTLANEPADDIVSRKFLHLM